jgi:DNA-binding CsgD family transcriptional regulator
MSNPWKNVPTDDRVGRYSPAPGIIPLSDRETRLPSIDETAGPRSGLPLATLGGVLDTIDQGIVLLQSDAYPCFSNSAARRLLMADGERGELAREIRSVSKAAFGSRDAKPTEVEIATGGGRYRMRATLLLEKIKEIRSRAVIVTIERAQSTLPTREHLMQRFGMTGREADVALLLASGRRNAVIASELHISTHTARHHTESVLAKLNVHARGEVARAIAGGNEAEATTKR